jgi:GDP-4-dehydro-6-deoxy-D-mannose reductase
MKALVTGCTGFVGAHLVEFLLTKGVEVHGLVRETATPKHTPQAAQVVQADILDDRAVADILGRLRPDQIYNLAAVTSVPASLREPRLTYLVNVTGALNIYEAVRNQGFKTRMLNVSSAQVYGSLAPGRKSFSEDSELNPSTPYAASKIMGEYMARSYVKAYGLDIISVRSFNHIGPGQSTDFVCSALARQIVLMQKGLQPPVLWAGNLAVERDFTDVRDIVAAYWLLLQRGASGGTYNACTGKVHSVKSIVDRLRALSGMNIELRIDPERLRSKDNLSLCGDPSRLREQTGWSPHIPLEQSLSDLLQYWAKEIEASPTLAAGQ